MQNPEKTTTKLWFDLAGASSVHAARVDPVSRGWKMKGRPQEGNNTHTEFAMGTQNRGNARKQKTKADMAPSRNSTRNL